MARRKSFLQPVTTCFKEDQGEWEGPRSADINREIEPYMNMLAWLGIGVAITQEVLREPNEPVPS